MYGIDCFYSIFSFTWWPFKFLHLFPFGFQVVNPTRVLFCIFKCVSYVVVRIPCNRCSAYRIRYQFRWFTSLTRRRKTNTLALEVYLFEWLFEAKMFHFVENGTSNGDTPLKICKNTFLFLLLFSLQMIWTAMIRMSHGENHIHQNYAIRMIVHQASIW